VNMREVGEYHGKPLFEIASIEVPGQLIEMMRSPDGKLVLGSFDYAKGGGTYGKRIPSKESAYTHLQEDEITTHVRFARSVCP
jgi:hypothetical protein